MGKKTPLRQVTFICPYMLFFFLPFAGMTEHTESHTKKLNLIKFRIVVHFKTFFQIFCVGLRNIYGQHRVEILIEKCLFSTSENGSGL